MTKPGKIWIVLLLACMPVAGTFAADLKSRTSAQILDNDDRITLTAVDSVLLIELQQQPLLTREDIIVTWRRAGGVQPTPFRIAIPAGCFLEVRDRLVINDAACGVQITLDGTHLVTDAFAARLVPPSPLMIDDPYRLRIRLELALDAAAARSLLSTLGGAEVSVLVGTERSVSPASEVLSKSGIDPTPF